MEGKRGPVWVYVHVCVCMYMYVCVCMCVCDYYMYFQADNQTAKGYTHRHVCVHVEGNFFFAFPAISDC